MSQVSPQVDVGGLTLNGLAAFAPVLAALSADDVPPLAMIQMKNLGSLFHINGQYALQVPDLLQRCKSTRVDRLGLLIGWRKGDAASLMAQSAGGQAISLLSMCILNIYDVSNAGQLFTELSKKALSQTTAISSPSQLVKVATILSSKLQVLGFGNILAAQVVRIYDAYKHFGKPVPDNFLDMITPDEMAELLYALTRAVREESTIVRITGSRSMGHILAIVTILFPEDAFVTMENVIVFEGLRKSILLEFADSGVILNVQIESKLQIQSTLPILPIEKLTRMNVDRQYGYSYKWNGCMADMLQVMFTDDGSICPEPLRVACCDMLEPLAKTFGSANGEPDITGLLGNHSFAKLLGPYPHGRIDQVCQKLWRIPPGWARPTSSLKSAIDNLVKAFAEATPTVSCKCDPKKRCSTMIGWEPTRDASKWYKCPLYRLWQAVGETIGCGFSCLFVNADDDATIIHPKDYQPYTLLLSIVSNLLNLRIAFRNPNIGKSFHETVYSCVMKLCGSAGGIAASSNSSTVFMAALQTPHLPNAMNGLFILLDGQLIYNGRYHDMLMNTGLGRALAKKDIHQRPQPIIPSNIGHHSSFSMTIREGVRSLELTSTVDVGGTVFYLNMFTTILGSWAVDETKPCDHSTKTPLEAQYEGNVITTSVASPGAIIGNISIVQVLQNPMAQLLSCVQNIHTLLQKNCCLNCAYKEAVKGKYGMIIVG